MGYKKESAETRRYEDGKVNLDDPHEKARVAMLLDELQFENPANIHVAFDEWCEKRLLVRREKVPGYEVMAVVSVNFLKIQEYNGARRRFEAALRLRDRRDYAAKLV
jgi:hypothetical protein